MTSLPRGSMTFTAARLCLPAGGERNTGGKCGLYAYWALGIAGHHTFCGDLGGRIIFAFGGMATIRHRRLRCCRFGAGAFGH